jgi:hypothetical protein
MDPTLYLHASRPGGLPTWQPSSMRALALVCFTRFPHSIAHSQRRGGPIPLLWCPYGLPKSQQQEERRQQNHEGESETWIGHVVKLERVCVEHWGLNSGLTIAQQQECDVWSVYVEYCQCMLPIHYRLF